MSVNKVILIGNVGKDPEVRYLDQSQQNVNAKVASFTLATTERYRDRTTNELKEITEWHNIVAWRNNADVVERYVKKGTQLYIEGRIRTRQWTDQSGNKRYTTEIMADNLQLLGKRQDNPGAGDGGYQPNNYATPAYQQPQAPQPAYQQPQPAQTDTPPEDDLPF